MRLLFLALAAALTGCYSDEIFVRPCDANADDCGGLENLTAESNDAIYEAQEILGFPIRITHKSRGAVTLILVSGERDEYWGRSIATDRPCYHVAHAVRRGYVIAHEIGHAMGLAHVCEGSAQCEAEGKTDRLMSSGGYGTELADWEVKKMLHGIRLQEACRGD